MAAQRQIYSDFAACMRSNGADPVRPHRWLFPPWLGGDGEIGVTVPAACAPQMADACRLCVCCRHCPCSATPSYLTYVACAVGVGVVLLALVANSAPYSAAERFFRSKTRAAGGDNAPTLPQPSHPGRGEQDATPAAAAAAATTALGSFSNQERSVVRRAVNLWHSHGVVTDAQRSTLLRSAEDDDVPSQPHPPPPSSVSVIVPVLVILAFVVALYESATSETVLHALLSPLAWRGGVAPPALGKALAMLVLAALTEVWPDVGGGGRQWEVPRAFFFMAFVGSVVISAVDTGRHEGETSGGDRDGSDLWYATVGCLGTIGMAVLGYAAPRHFRSASTWIRMAMLLPAYGCETHLGRTLTAILSLVLTVTSLLIGRTTNLASKEELTCDIHETGMFYLVFSAAMADFDEPVRSQAGLMLGTTGLLVVSYGAACDRSTFQAALGTAAMCVASGLAWWDHRSSIIGGLNLPLRLAIAFFLATMVVGGWGLMPLIRLPPKSFVGVTNTLVGATLVLLLIVIVTGNSHHGDEWSKMMDFESGDSFVDGGYAYENRGIYIVPWCAPLVLYNRLLYRLWPDLEREFRNLHVLRLGVLLAVACHLLRLLSWSMLFLTLAGLAATLPHIEDCLRGGP